MTCYPNSLDAQAVRSAGPRVKEADGREIKLILFGDLFFSYSLQSSAACAKVKSLQTSNDCIHKHFHS